MAERSERARGRPRGYDAGVALERATARFWRAGYSGTSLDELSAATGMHRPSLYAAFGDKRDLYLAAMDRYLEQALADMAEALADTRPVQEGLQRVYDRALATYFADARAPMGCFLIGTAATEAGRDPRVRSKLGSALRELTRGIEARLRLARDRGEIRPDADPALLAQLAAAVLFSLALRSRAGDSRASLRRFARASVTQVCG